MYGYPESIVARHLMQAAARSVHGTAAATSTSSARKFGTTTRVVSTVIALALALLVTLAMAAGPARAASDVSAGQRYTSFCHATEKDRWLGCVPSVKHSGPQLGGGK